MAKKRPTKKPRSTAGRKAPAKAARTTAKKMKPTRRKPAARAAAPTGIRSAPDPIRALAQRIIDLTIGEDDEGSLALYADDVESTEARNPPLIGMEAIRQKFKMWRGMVSESAWQARHLAVEGNTIFIEWSGRVTMAATGKQVEFNEVAVHEIQNGKIVRERFYYDPSVLQS